MKPTFTLTLTATPDPTAYQISAASPAGSARSTAPVVLPPADIAAARAIFSRDRPDLTRPLIDDFARRFGAQVFNALIASQPDIRRLYDLTLERAAGTGMNILIIDDTADNRPRIPFELLRDPDRDFLALSRTTPILRGRTGLTPRPPARVDAPLRALVVIASPVGLAALDTDDEWNRLNEATRTLQQARLLTLTRLPQASSIAVQRILREQEFQIVHFIGHSDYDAASGQGLIVLESEDGSRSPQVISAEQIGRELGEESGIRLVILNTCRSGQPAETDALRGIATNLITRGIPAVVAMQFPISDTAARNFAEEFYRALAAFLPIDEAVSEGRRAIVNRGSGLNAAEWMTPIVYLRAASARLFEPVARPVEYPVNTPPTVSATVPPPAPHPASAAPVNPLRWLLIAGGGIAALLIVVIGFFAVRGVLVPIATPTPAPVTVTPTTGLPNLRTTGILVSPRRPAPGELFRVRVTIVNDGTADSGPFSYTWDSSITDPVQLNSFIGDVPNIPPGGGHSISIPFIYGWWDVYDTQIVVDARSQVTETDELDNRRPFSIDVATDEPFILDFTTLPDAPVIDLPTLLTAESFARWNLRLAAVDAANVPCTAQIIELGSVVALAAAPPCSRPTLALDITRASVGGADLEIAGDGTAEVAFFTNTTDAAPVFNLAARPLTADPQSFAAGSAADPTAPLVIRRIVVRGSGNMAITRLLLLPPG